MVQRGQDGSGQQQVEGEKNTGKSLVREVLAVVTYISLCLGNHVSATDDENSPIKTWLAREKQGNVFKASSMVFKLLPIPHMRVCEHIRMLLLCFAILLFLLNDKETYEFEMYQQ